MRIFTGHKIVNLFVCTSISLVGGPKTLNCFNCLANRFQILIHASMFSVISLLVCKAFEPNHTMCICEYTCPPFEDLVCLSNGTGTYNNECLLQYEMCYLKANFTIYHPGDCTGNVNRRRARFIRDRSGNGILGHLGTRGNMLIWVLLRQRASFTFFEVIFS